MVSQGWQLCANRVEWFTERPCGSRRHMGIAAAWWQCIQRSIHHHRSESKS